MILTGYEIKKRVEKGEITIRPFCQKRINPNSYNYRLANIIIEINENIIDPKKESSTIKYNIQKNGFILYPGKIYLAHTIEIIGSDKYVMSLIGRSTLGRLGLWLQVCADLGHTGTKQRWTLELKVTQPLRVYAGMNIGQVSFWKVHGKEKTLYKGLYHKDLEAKQSYLFKNYQT